jgi:two-component system cell cycle sensor histidine kinase/response regulator CckA
MGAAPLRLLLVEDSADDRRLIRAALEPAGFAVEAVDRLAAAVERCAEQPFDAVLLDLSLPDSEGFDTLAQLKPAANTPAIVILTGRDDQAPALAAVRAGAEEYVVKGEAATPLLARLIRHAVERRRARAEREALALVGRELVGTLDPDLVCRRIVEAVRGLLAATTAGLYEQDPESGVLHLRASACGPRPSFEWSPTVAPGLGLTAVALGSRRPVSSTDVLADPRVVYSDDLRRRMASSDRAVLVLPLLAHERVVGALVVAARTGRTFTDDEIHLAQQFAHQATLGLVSARLHQDVERRRRETEIIANVARSINGSLERATVLEAIISAARHLCRADRARIAWREEDASGPVFRWWPSRGPADPHEDRLESGRGPEGEALATGRPVRVLERTATPADGRSLGLHPERDRARLLVPVHVDRRVEALLEVGRRASEPFTERDEAALLRLADHAALAIRNSDLFERERAARAAAEQAHGSLRLLFASAPLPMAVVDATNDRILEVNDAAVGHYGYSRDEFLRLRWLDLLHPEDQSGTLAGLAHPVAGDDGGVWRSPTVRHVTHGGRTIDVEILAHALEYDGRPARLVVVLDVTERRRAWEELRRSEEQFSKIFHAGMLAMSLTALDGRIVDCNERYAAMFGYERSAMLGRTVYELGLWADPADREPLVERVLAEGRIRDVAVRFRRRSGEVFDAELSVESIEFPEGAFLIGVMNDVTERRRAEAERAALEEQLRQAQKMEAVGRLAGGVAHDFNNLLAVIGGRAELLLQRLSADDPRRRHVEIIGGAVRRGAGLARQLLVFGRRQLLRPRVLDLNQVVRDVQPLLRRLVGEDVEFAVVLQAAPGRVLADPVQLEQILLNLAANARDAMPHGGRLAIETRLVRLDRAFADRHPGSAAGEYVSLAVTDTGVGMSDEVRARAFEPFFTTKEPGRGTGLGLATVYGVVKQMGGHVTLESAVGRGTAVTVYLPLAAEAEPEAETAVRNPAPRGGRETVLLVEDERDVRELAIEILEGYGYRVLPAGGPAEALALAERHPGPIHLLLTDVVMPGLSGPELARSLATSRPDLRVLYMSGYSEHPTVQRDVLDPEAALLPKPFSSEELAGRVREILDG